MFNHFCMVLFKKTTWKCIQIQFLDNEMEQVVEIFHERQEPVYWLLMTGHHKEPGHQQDLTHVKYSVVHMEKFKRWACSECDSECHTMCVNLFMSSESIYELFSICLSLKLHAEFSGNNKGAKFWSFLSGTWPVCCAAEERHVYLWWWTCV